MLFTIYYINSKNNKCEEKVNVKDTISSGKNPKVILCVESRSRKIVIYLFIHTYTHTYIKIGIMSFHGISNASKLQSLHTIIENFKGVQWDQTFQGIEPRYLCTPQCMFKICLEPKGVSLVY